MMTKEEAVRYIEDSSWSTTRLGLGRTIELLGLLGDPQKKLKFVHVAGSNGKGSTCAIVSSVLRAAGFRTGLYTSPHLIDFNERFEVNGERISDDLFTEITSQVRDAAEKMEDHPSQFELSTAIAMLYFLHEKCDIVVLEVGMGGALDSTNAIDAPEVAVITNIGLEHTEYLGDTLAEVASAKAGIIKAGCSCVSYDSLPEVKAVIEERCKELGVPLTYADFDSVRQISEDLDGQVFTWRGGEYRIKLLGDYQLRNAATSLAVIDALKARGWEISDEAIREGLENVRWAARMSVMAKEPVFILDGGHNPQCAEALAESLVDILKGRKAVFLTGVLGDKDYPQMLDKVLPFAAEFICLTPDSDRALTADELAEYLHSVDMKATPCADPESGIRLALDRAGLEGSVICFGSLYMAGAILNTFPAVYKKWLREQKIAARNALSREEVLERSHRIVRNIAQSPEFARAKTVMIYSAVGCEVTLEELPSADESYGKTFVYPLCIEDRKMLALKPHADEEGAWMKGSFGIPEPVREKSDEYAPQEIDLVVCPCTSFDEKGGRLGMGGGYYDRFLPECTSAAIVLVAFEAQKTKEVPKEANDVPVDACFTEEAVYRPW